MHALETESHIRFSGLGHIRYSNIHDATSASSYSEAPSMMRLEMKPSPLFPIFWLRRLIDSLLIGELPATDLS